MIDIYVAPECRRQGLATFLLGEAFRQLQPEGFSQVETQTFVTNEMACGLLHKLGFQEFGQGVVLRKDIAS